MNILLCLDPSTLTEELLLNRVPTFKKIAQELIKKGHLVTVYGSNEVHSEYIKDSIKVKHISSSNEFDLIKIKADLNSSLLYTNQATNEINRLILDDVSKINETPDLLIATAPTSVFRKIWPTALFLHYELGIFNREPFPIHHQFDPGGYHGKSILSKYLSLNIPIDHDAVNKINNLSDQWLGKIGLNSNEVGSIDSIYVPLPSYKNWTVKSEISYIDRIEYLKVFANENGLKKIVCNEKPQHPLTVEERKKIDKIKNVQLIENDNINGSGGILCILCKYTYTFSPSLSLQTIFWGNKLYAHPDSSMSLWSNHKNARNHLAGYFNIFNLTEFSDIDERIEIWKNFNPYKPIIV